LYRRTALMDWLGSQPIASMARLVVEAGPWP
jgi:hypothetical protein